MATKPTRSRAATVKKADVPGKITVLSRIIDNRELDPDAPGGRTTVVLTDEMEEVEVQCFETEPARIKVSAGATKKLDQDYEFLRVDVGADIPCYVERMDQTFEYAAEWVADRLYEEIDSYMEGDETDGGEED